MTISTQSPAQTRRRTLSAPANHDQLVSLDAGRVQASAPFLGMLEHEGLCTVADVIDHRAGQLLRALPHRENWRLTLTGERNQRVVAYLKKHRSRGWKNWLRAKLKRAATGSAARDEAENIVRLQQAGIPSMRLIAFGEALSEQGDHTSFLLTEELAGFTQLDHFLRQRFSTLAESPRPDKALHELIRSVAVVAQRFHAADFNHRDLYCCHFFINEANAGRFQVNLIDLQRVQQRRWFRRRWVVKDLAQLAYSAPAERISRTMRMRFIKKYLGTGRLVREHKELVRSILARQAHMERRLGAHP